MYVCTVCVRVCVPLGASMCVYVCVARMFPSYGWCVYISYREIGRRVRDAMKKAKYSLSIAINRLAQSYSMLILAIGLDNQHHSMRGRYADEHTNVFVINVHTLHLC